MRAPAGKKADEKAGEKAGARRRRRKSPAKAPAKSTAKTAVKTAVKTAAATPDASPPRSAEDEALLAQARERRRLKPLPQLVDSGGQTKPDTEDLKLWTVKLQRAFGSESGPAALKQLVQLAKVHGAAVINGSGALDVNADIAAVAGIQPRDHLESMIATQMVALHNFGMYAFAQAMRQGQTVDGQALCLSQATRLLRSFREHVEALQRYRGKGQQRVTVEHVHVHQGGQAIVGVGAVQVPARSGASLPAGGGDATEK